MLLFSRLSVGNKILKLILKLIVGVIEQKYNLTKELS